MTTTSDPNTEVQVLSDVPDDKVAGIVTLLQASERYVSHKVIPEGGGKNRIEATMKKELPPS